MFDFLKNKKFNPKKTKDPIYNIPPINMDTSICGICSSNNVYQGGSWTPEKCRDCGAVFIMGVWMKEY